MSKYIIVLVAVFILLGCGTKQLKYKYHHKSEIVTLSPKRNFSNYLPKNFGHVTSPSYLIKVGIYFPNTLNEVRKVNSIIIKIKGSSSYNLSTGKSSQNKNDKYGPIIVNVYDFDSTELLPASKYLVNDTLVKALKEVKKLY